jgi:hypothetical protein
MSSQVECNDCPICMEVLELGKNHVTTECGHCFHTKCLMTSVAHNGFGCPYCRSVMAEEVIEDEDEDDDYEEDSIYDYEDNEDNLRGFRLFFNQVNGDEPDEQDLAQEDVMNVYAQAALEQQQSIPSLAFVTEKLVEQGVTMEQLVKAMLSVHEEYHDDETFERTDDELFGKTRVIISNYNPVEQNNPVAA